MKLNASILYHDLSKQFSCEYYGPETMDLKFGRPDVYYDSEAPFPDGSILVALAKHLPARPSLGDDVVVICVGRSNHLQYYKTHCTLIHLPKEENIIDVMQAIHHIYDRYDEWNDRLMECIRQEEDILEYLKASLSVFGRQLGVYDKDFTPFVSVSEDTDKEFARWNQGENTSTIPYSSFGQYLENYPLQTSSHEPLHIEYEGTSALSINLFDGQNNYIGALAIDREPHQFNLRDDSLAIYLAELLEEQLSRTGYRVNNEHNQIKQVLIDLLGGLPISPRSLATLRRQTEDHRFICVSLHSLTDFSKIYSNYISNLIEKNFTNSFSFAFENGVVNVLDLDNFADKNGEYIPCLCTSLTSMLNSLKLSAGISNDFNDLEHLSQYYAQAECAYEHGSHNISANNYFFFSTYALIEMLSNALGGFPAEMYFPKGLKKLIEHDQNSNVKYMDTLKVFLEENMSLNRTAEELFIHRSTLVDRIDRMKKELEIDFDDPNERLQLMMVLKAMEVEDYYK